MKHAAFKHVLWGKVNGLYEFTYYTTKKAAREAWALKSAENPTSQFRYDIGPAFFDSHVKPDLLAANCKHLLAKLDSISCA